MEKNVKGIHHSFLAKQNIDNVKWIVDCLATNHMTHNKNLLNNTRMIYNRFTWKVYFPYGNYIEVSCFGSCDLENGRKVKNVLYIAKFQYIFLSISKLKRDLRCFVSVCLDVRFMLDLHSGKVKGNCRVVDGLYRMQLQLKDFQLTMLATVQSNIVTAGKDLAVGHERLGHAPYKVFGKISNMNFDSSNSNRIKDCTICPLARQRRMSFPITNNRIVTPLEVMAIDVYTGTL